MDYFQGRAQLIFISFCLKNQTTGNVGEPTLPSTGNPAELRPTDTQSPRQHIPASSSFSQDSEADVTAYAHAVVQRLAQNQEDDLDITLQSIGMSPKTA